MKSLSKVKCLYHLDISGGKGAVLTQCESYIDPSENSSVIHHSELSQPFDTHVLHFGLSPGR